MLLEGVILGVRGVSELLLRKLGIRTCEVLFGCALVKACFWVLRKISC